MNRAFVIAAVLSLVAAGIRSWDGETGPLRVVRDSGLDDTIVGFFHLTWYMVTVVFVVVAALLGYYGVNRGRTGTGAAGLAIGLLFIAWATCIGIVSSFFSWHPGTVIPMLVTFLIGSLALIGAKQGIDNPVAVNERNCA